MRLGPSQLMQLWVLPSASFVFSFSYLHAVHLGAPPKGTTTRLKATARPPLGVVAWWCCVISLSVRSCVLVQVLPFAVARDNGISRVCSSE
jgi:hypothetical protein